MLGFTCMGFHRAMAEVGPQLAGGAGQPPESVQARAYTDACTCPAATHPRCLHPSLRPCPPACSQGVLFGMLATYIPSYPVPGLGRINGSVWSLTDLLLGACARGGEHSLKQGMRHMQSASWAVARSPC